MGARGPLIWANHDTFFVRNPTRRGQVGPGHRQAPACHVYAKRVVNDAADAPPCAPVEQSRKVALGNRSPV